MERKLASVQVISDLRPIDGADSIECARILGWNVVVKKGEFKVGDKCIYFEIDSVLPDVPEFDFMRNKNFRVKTIRLRGQISQGLAIPMSVASEILHGRQAPNIFVCDFNVGLDVTDILGVSKWEPPVPQDMSVKGNFPSFLFKTDEIRVQSVPEILDEFQGAEVCITVKLDGTSMTMYHWNGEIGVCSRNFELKRPEEGKGSKYWDMLNRYRMERIPDGYAIQGELCGPGIQNNRLGLTEQDFFVFNVYDIKRGEYLNVQDANTFCSFFGLNQVPVHYVGAFNWTTVDSLLEEAKGFYGNGHPREGIVIRSTKNWYSNVLGGRASFKVINNDFLLKVGE